MDDNKRLLLQQIDILRKVIDSLEGRVRAEDQLLEVALNTETPNPDRLGVHLAHCNFGEYVGNCKYTDDSCPALSEDWSWFGLRLTTRDKDLQEVKNRLDTAVIHLQKATAENEQLTNDLQKIRQFVLTVCDGKKITDDLEQ